MDTHIYKHLKDTGKAAVEVMPDNTVCICRTVYDRDTGAPTEEHSPGITLDELIARRDATARDLASLDVLIADAEAAGATRQKP
jgi:hypothetical protein